MNAIYNQPDSSASKNNSASRATLTFELKVNNFKRSAYLKRVSKLPRLHLDSRGNVIVSVDNLDIAIKGLPGPKSHRAYLSAINECAFDVCFYANETLRQKMGVKNISTVKRCNRSLNGKWVDINPEENDGYMEKNGYVCRTTNVYLLKVEALLLHAQMLEESLRPRRLGKSLCKKMPPPPTEKSTPNKLINKPSNNNKIIYTNTSLLLSPKKELREENKITFSEVHKVLEPVYEEFDRIHSQEQSAISKKRFTKTLLRQQFVKTPEDLFKAVSVFTNTNTFIDQNSELKEPNCSFGPHSYGRLLHLEDLKRVAYAKRPKPNYELRRLMDQYVNGDGEKDLPGQAIALHLDRFNNNSPVEILLTAYPNAYSKEQAHKVVQKRMKLMGICLEV